MSIEDDFKVQDFGQPYNICKFPPNLSLALTKVVIYFPQIFSLWFFFFFFHKTFFEFFFFSNFLIYFIRILFLDDSHYNSKKTKHVKSIIEFQYKCKTWNKFQFFEIKWMQSTQFISKFHLKIQIFESNAQTIRLVLLMYYVKIEIKIEITKVWQNIVSSQILKI